MILFVLVVILLVLLFIVLFRQYKSLKIEEKSTQSFGDIMQLKSIGELSVFQIFSKEIVTKKDSAFNGIWKNLLAWSLSER